MKQFALLMLLGVASLLNLYAHSFDDQKYNRTVFTNQIRIDNPAKQTELRQQWAWKQFTRQYGHWYAEFNAFTGLPLRAAGTPVNLGTSGTHEQLAMAFINSALKNFSLPAASLQFTRINQGNQFSYVQFTQYYEGLEVLANGLSVRINKNNQVAAFTADVFNNISVSTQPVITAQNALLLSVADVPGNYTDNTTPTLKVLPIPGAQGYTFKLVYDFTIKGTTNDNQPVFFRIWLDAHNGAIYYRRNIVCSIDIEEAESLFTVSGAVTPNPTLPTQNVNLPNMRIRVGTTDFFTDANGILNYEFAPGFPVAATGTAYLEGPFCRLFNGISGSTVPSFPVTIEPGATQIAVPAGAVTATQISAFYYVTQQHNFMKSWIPGMTLMDFPMVTRVDRTDGNCNAFYDGSVNFYAQGGGCPATALFNDIVFHEYGHGINYYFYNYKGGDFNNGSLGEGYADVWALGHTQFPILAKGFNTANPNSSIRRYDINPKVYPQDLTGQVHDNGEIIAGAWWDLGLQIGVEPMFAIYIQSHDGVPMRPDGQEGTLYSDILFEALIADDDNGNLSDGTPNSIAIIDNFALHGILLQISGEMNHNEYPIIAPTELASVNFTLNIDFNYLPFIDEVGLWYRTNRTAPYAYTNAVALSGVGNYTAFIPFLPAGTIVDYYLELRDNVGGVPYSNPYLANRAANPNLPFQMLVGYNVLQEDNLFGTATQWTIGAPGDNATSGIWTIGSPTASYVNETQLVQTGTDRTPDTNNNCAFTGNAAVGAAPGTNDVDNGRTTLTSKPFNLMQFENPAFSYYRWYANDQGANPGNDFWQVLISNDGGNNWVTVENTNVADHSWRLASLRVLDYVTLTPDVRIRFIASDNVISGQPSDAQSLVEAAIDDLVLYEQADETATGLTPVTAAAFQVYPNPANDYLMLHIPALGNSNTATATLLNTLGQVVYHQNNLPANTAQRISTANLPQGIYLLQVNQQNQITTHKVLIQK